MSSHLVFGNVRGLTAKIVENRSPHRYLYVLMNVIHIVDEHLPPDIHREHQINLACMILNDIGELRGLQRLHRSSVESLYDILDRERAANKSCVIL